MVNKVKSFYDSLYTDNPGVFGSSSTDLLGRVLDLFPTLKGAALDVGAGEGVTSNLLAERGFDVIALDISDQAFKGIKKELGTKTIAVPIEDFIHTTQYSLVHIALVLHHLPETTAVSVVKLLQTSTSRGGVHIFRIFTNNGCANTFV